MHKDILKKKGYVSPSKSVSFRQVYVPYSHKYMYNHGELLRTHDSLFTVLI